MRIVVYLVLFCTTVVSAQQDSVQVDSFKGVIYAGLLGNVNFPIDSSTIEQDASLWVGVDATWEISPKVTLFGYTVLGLNSEGASSINGFGLTLAPQSSIAIDLGYVAMTSTFLHRPYPVSAAGQFETWSTSQVTPSAPGIRMNIGSEERYVSSSVGIRNGRPEYHFGGALDNFCLSGWYQDDTTCGVAVTFTSKLLATSLVIKPDVIANVLMINVTEDITLYSDFGHTVQIIGHNGHEQHRVVRGEWGVVKFLTGSSFNGAVALGYSEEIRSVKGYIFVYL